MTGTPDAEPAVRHCPYCGSPLGSFFGVRADDGCYWCERCGEFFRVSHVREEEGSEAAADGR